MQADGQKHQSRDHGRPGCAVDAEPDAENQQRIREQGDDSPRQRNVHRPARIAGRPQDARERHAEPHRDIGGDDDREQPTRDARGRLLRMHEPRQRVVAKDPEPERQRRRHEPGDDEPGSREPAGAGSIARAERTRNRRRKGDGQADIDRHQHEGQLAGVADRGLVGLHAETRDPEQRDDVDRENRDEPDRAGGGHDGDMAHQRARRKYGRVNAGGGSTGHGRFLGWGATGS
jgi:hypothetical protein